MLHKEIFLDIISKAKKTAKKRNPALWSRIKSAVKAGSKGGRAGQWSARKAQLAVQRYKKSGGGYKGKKTGKTGLSRWTKQKWGTKSGKPSRKTGERYLPKKARQALSPQEYGASTRAKRKATKQGKQFSAQPKKIARKTAKYRKK
jgi:hypothetical protein|tara:strand:+ start:758 stop:1195 length:438 start_codon:yes stop_codon:yes gene_type:complete